MSTHITSHVLDIQEPASPTLNAAFHQAMLERQIGLPKDNPSDPTTSFELFRAFELGWYRRLHVDDHIHLHQMLRELIASPAPSSAHASRIGVIHEILSHSPWLLLPGLGLVLRADITPIVTAIAKEVLNTCDYQFSKGRPAATVNITSLVSNRLNQLSMNGQ